MTFSTSHPAADSVTTATPATGWVFGYGSLIWRPDFDWLNARPATVHGWSRRFWQGSHDHRGTPEAPGRVVTLVPEACARCAGMAYELEDATLSATFEQLDLREQNGYERVSVTLSFSLTESVEGLVYIATERNPAWLGPDSVAAMAQQIAVSHGPSGSNRDYLLNLDLALAELGFDDPHVHELANTVRAL